GVRRTGRTGAAAPEASRLAFAGGRGARQAAATGVRDRSLRRGQYSLELRNRDRRAVADARPLGGLRGGRRSHRQGGQVAARVARNQWPLALPLRRRRSDERARRLRARRREAGELRRRHGSRIVAPSFFIYADASRRLVLVRDRSKRGSGRQERGDADQEGPGDAALYG